MGWSSRLFLLSADDMLHRLASAAFARMLQPDNRSRLPGFAHQRVRLASITIELADRVPLGVRHSSYLILDFDADGVPDGRRLNAQQAARLDTMLAGVLGVPGRDTSVIEASSRFIAQGGTWQPDPRLRQKIEAAAMGILRCRRAHVVG